MEQQNQQHALFHDVCNRRLCYVLEITCYRFVLKPADNNNMTIFV